MDKNISKQVKIQLVIVCCWFGAAFGTSFFGRDFKARPSKIVNTGYGEIYRVLTPNVRQRASLGWSNPYSHNWNIIDNQNSYFSNPNPTFNVVGDFRRIQQYQNKLPQDNNPVFDTRIPNKKVHGPDSDVPGPLNSQRTNLNTGVSAMVSDDFVIEASVYEAPTDEEGEIGGPPPAIVASLLG